MCDFFFSVDEYSVGIFGLPDKYYSLKYRIEELFRISLSTLEMRIDANLQEINCSFIDEVDIKDMNRTFRGVDHTTDVLSFRYEQLADIYISISYIEKSTPKYSKGLVKNSELDIENEILRMILHGFMHCIGFDHSGYLGESDEDMFIVQEDILIDLFRNVL